MPRYACKKIPEMRVREVLAIVPTISDRQEGKVNSIMKSPEKKRKSSGKEGCWRLKPNNLLNTEL